MDIFKQKRYLIIFIVVLTLLNLGTLLLLWMGRPSHNQGIRESNRKIKEEARLEHLLNAELGFDETQTGRYLEMRQEHRRQTHRLNEEIRQIKKQMFDEVLQEKPRQKLSDSLLTLAQEKQAQIEQLTFQHFLDLKKLCKPEQQKKLKLLMHEVFRKNPPPPNNIENRPPPPPAGEEPPPPRGDANSPSLKF